MALEHIYQVTLAGNLRSQEIRNVFFYRDMTELSPSVALATDLRRAFAQSFLPVPAGTGFLDDMFSAEVTYTSVEVVNLSDPTALHTFLTNSSPGGLADLTSPFAAMGFRTNRVRTDIRRGQKRIAGVADTDYANGVLASGVQAPADALADLLGSDKTNSLDPLTTWRHVIVGRIKYISPSGRTAYRLPETDEELRYFDATQWEVRPNMTTQNTRKVGRGI